MLYVHKAPIKGGRSYSWRLFADTTAELEKVKGGTVSDLGKPSEHKIVSTAEKNRLSAKEIDDREVVKLIKSKRNQISEAQNEAFAKALSELEPEPVPDFEKPQDGPEASEEEPPRRGGLKIRNKPEPEEPEEDGQDEADQRE